MTAATGDHFDGHNSRFNALDPVAGSRSARGPGLQVRTSRLIAYGANRVNGRERASGSDHDLANVLEEGSSAPAFRLSTDSGGDIAHSTLRGRAYVLYFYPKDDTSGCTREAIDFSRLSDRFAAAGVVVIGISKDTVASHEKFRKKHDLTVTLASDPETQAARAFGVWVEKSMYGRRYMGMDRATFLVDSQGRIRRIWRKVKVPGHAAAVLDAAQVL